MKAEIDDIAAHKDVGIFREAVRSAEADFVEGKGSREEVERARAAYLNKSLEAFKEPISQWDKVYKLSALRDYFPSVR